MNPSSPEKIVITAYEVFFVLCIIGGTSSRHEAQTEISWYFI
jgi:hypothetical protein